MCRSTIIIVGEYFMTSVQAINSSPTFTANNVPKKQYIGTMIGGATAATLGALVLASPASKGARILMALKQFAKALPIFAGTGFIVDYLNNRQREKISPNAKTDKGNDYTKVNNGKKYGALLGIVAPLINRLFNKNTVQAPLGVKIAALPFMIIGMGMSALFGYGLGALTDKLENSQAAKEADKVA